MYLNEYNRFGTCSLLAYSFISWFFRSDQKNRGRVSARQWCTGSFGEKFALQDFPQKLFHSVRSFCNFTVTREKRWNVLRLKRLEFWNLLPSSNRRIWDTRRSFVETLGFAIKQRIVVAERQVADHEEF